VRDDEPRARPAVAVAADAAGQRGELPVREPERDRDARALCPGDDAQRALVRRRRTSSRDPGQNLPPAAEARAGRAAPVTRRAFWRFDEYSTGGPSMAIDLTPEQRKVGEQN